MPKSIKKIEDLSFDSKNINKGSEFGTALLHKSLTETGAGRSVLADKNGVLVAGNKTVEAAMQVGISKIRVVQTTGDELVIVQRTDIDINTPEGARLKILDNTVSKVNYVEDAEVAEAVCEEYSLDGKEYGLSVETVRPGEGAAKDPFDDEGIGVKNQYGVIVMCENEGNQESVYKDLTAMGYNCKIVVT